MNFADRYTRIFRYLLPAPFTIALLLTVLTFLLAFFFTDNPASSGWQRGIQLLEFWEDGLWNGGLMVFAMQMMLMLVLGHTLALTPFFSKLINRALQYCTDTSRAAFLVTFFTVCVALFNWGLGLIFGAIFARKVAEYAGENRIPINYPLIGAAGYSGLMVWHGGLSGSSLAKVSEHGHLQQLMGGILNADQLENLPAQITFSDTVFSPMNLTATLILVVFLPLAMYILGRHVPVNIPAIAAYQPLIESETDKPTGLEKLDVSRWPAYTFGAIILFYGVYKAIIKPAHVSLGFITPDFINFTLLGLALIFHGKFSNFLNAVDNAISGVSGILIQFPLYFGIMGIMKSSGLVNVFSDFFVTISNSLTFPLFTFFSAGLVNVFVPSGGGQWAVQGPIIVKAATELNVPLAKGILAMAYGDQITNMLQPFWALPLLGITGLKAKEILPYTLFLMLIGIVVFVACLLLF